MGGDCVLSSNGDRFGVLYYKLFVNRRYGVQKNC